MFSNLFLRYFALFLFSGGPARLNRLWLRLVRVVLSNHAAACNYEFIVILPGCAQETAENRISSIRTRLSEELASPYSFSYGISYAPGNTADSVEKLIRSADQAMYRDKQARAD